jgi:hypothetical protein
LITERPRLGADRKRDSKTLDLLWLASLLETPTSRGNCVIYELGARAGGELYLENIGPARGGAGRASRRYNAKGFLEPAPAPVGRRHEVIAGRALEAIGQGRRRHMRGQR